MHIAAIHRFQNYLETEKSCQLTFQLMGAEKPIAAGFNPSCDWPHGNMNIHVPSAGLG